MTNFIPGPIAAKIITLGGYFGYLWTAKDQNINLRSSSSAAPVVTYHPEPEWNRVNNLDIS